MELPQAAGKGRLVSYEALPVASPLSGFFWTWVVPVVLFGISFAATWLLYRHFARRKREG